MISAIVNGTLFRTAESRISKNGKQFVSATIRVKDGDEPRFVRVVAFSETAQAELMRLVDGDALSVQGPLKAEVYEKDGEHRVSLSLFADHVLALRQPPRERKSKSPEPAATPPDPLTRQARLAGTWQSPAGGPDDEVPF